MERRIESYLNEGEEIIWYGKAKENDILYCKLMTVLPFMILWLLAECVILGVAVTNRILGDFNIYYLLLTIVAILLHLIPTGMWFASAVKENERINGEEYAVTRERIIILHACQHDHVEYVLLKDVYDVNVKRSPAEAILGTGKIIVETEEEKLYFHSIENAQKTFRRVYRAIKGKAEGNE